ncbi:MULTISPECIES: FKBP-type peptidyl-prolyl cis-trans isomerase [unclassified Rathayibacter]|uniref:FKBP-type peptidyl-prolyl cis-trans isomerase n=1 Tax=unclassified Rathayibacter TaxID=2609250 RepID=UPI00188CD040|nr:MULTISPECIES: FKBP-type peptidyl-prolyl cis-trans isomerase [unclassified Rathayibacter]MBF4461922.1 FKBP-type peptidyl-prolyl cis-trans isomerase [Rathayibacter sp. VKM Ac-2879]MBF4504035.1 FKBP-type peptidyl-prolyl cis-trans isomerase [Rathayibacter sp. VKM Ac-2878]
MRRTLAILAVLGVSLGLAACTSSAQEAAPTASATPLSCVSSGDATNAVQTSGDFGTKPVTVFPTPVSVDQTERAVTLEGTGPTVVEGDTVLVDYTLYNGSSGAAFSASTYAGGGRAAFEVDPTQYLTGLVKAVNCATVGSRVVAVVPPADAFGDAGKSDFQLSGTDSIVMVIDIRAIVPNAADGTPQPPVDGLPTVALADDGTPTVTVPSSNPPADLQIEVLKKGGGATAADGDSLIVQYQGVIWGTGAVFDQSWGKGKPATLTTGSVIEGFKEALVGQTVGSQVLVTIPPSKGYGDGGNQKAGISGTDTLVFVIDILAVN